MNNLDVSRYPVQELNSEEMINIEGGKIPYIEYQWSGTTNELIYAGEAVANGVRLVINGAIGVLNWFN